MDMVFSFVIGVFVLVGIFYILDEYKNRQIEEYYKQKDKEIAEMVRKEIDKLKGDKNV